LRAVAVSAVMIFHLAPSALPGGFTGVDIFFVISGYVVTASLVGRKHQSLRQFILGFYARRILRIFPALLVCIVVTSILVVAFIPPASWLGQTIRNTAVYAPFGLSNYALIWSSDGYFTPRAEFNPFTHTWSLAVEEQFYLIAPAIVYFWLTSRSQTGAKRIMPFGALVLLALISCGVAAYNTFAEPDAAFYLLPSRFWELACGVLLFQIQHERELPTNYLNGYGALFGTILILCALLFSDRAHFPFPWALASVAGTTLLIASFTARHARSSVVKSILSNRPIVYIGKISYSLYLWHWPIFVMLRWTVGLDKLWVMAAALVSAFLMAAASFHFVEQPIRKLRRFIVRPPWQTIAAGLAIMVLCLVVTNGIHARAGGRLSLSVTKNREVWSPYFFPTAQSGTCNVRVHEQAIGEFSAKGFIPTDCPNKGTSNGKLFVIGDSHATAYERMFFDLALDKRVEIWVYTAAGCSVVSLLKPIEKDRKWADCPKFFSAALADVKSKGKPNDIVFLASLRMVRLANQSATFDASEILARQRSDEAKQERDAALDEAREYIRRIQRLGFHVLIDAPKPVFRSIAFRCADWFNKMNPICSSDNRIPKRFLEDYRQNTMWALSKLKDEFLEISIWDPFYPLCPGDQCSSWDGDGPLFFDGDHLTGHGNQVLYPFFRQIVENAWGNARASEITGSAARVPTEPSLSDRSGH
jgi:peptidoglycan/LPS O-acetylase OafA/YrhL